MKLDIMLQQAAITVMLPVKNLERARAFYEKCLGFEPGERQADGKYVYAGAGAFLALFPKEEGTRAEHTAISFKVADGSATLPVAYKGILPDLFREGQGVVAEGALDSSGVFKADTVLAKHDETYMPKDVADALKKQGHWKDDYGTKPSASAAPQPAQGAMR